MYSASSSPTRTSTICRVSQRARISRSVSRRRYCIAVLKEKEGYGSNALHAKARVGDLYEVSWPRNLFPLVEEAERHWMIAGGIGITPFMAMIAELKRRRADFHLHY